MKAPAARHAGGRTGAAMRRSVSLSLLVGASFAVPLAGVHAQPAQGSAPTPAQPATPPANEEDEVVVTGKAPRG